MLNLDRESARNAVSRQIAKKSSNCIKRTAQESRVADVGIIEQNGPHGHRDDQVLLSVARLHLRCRRWRRLRCWKSERQVWKNEGLEQVPISGSENLVSNEAIQCIRLSRIERTLTAESFIALISP